MHKLPRVIHLDDSDQQVFERSAVPGELAIPGGFIFLEDSIEKLDGKRKQAFLHGFLGISSFGHATLVAIVTVKPEEYQNAINQLSISMSTHLNPPSRSQALHAAKVELDYAESICEFDEGTVLAVTRQFTDDEIKESFKKFIPNGSVDWEQGRPLVYEFESD